MSIQTETTAPTSESLIGAMTYRDAVNLALDEALASDPSVLLMGEDVANEGGVFKTNTGLADRYGRKRVLNTPICENGFVGVALGMSLMGLRPVVEIMFSDFLPTAADAIINQIAKYRFMTAGTCSVPLTIRAIGGGTGRFGTQHSATGESWFMGFPGLRVGSAGTPDGIYAVLSSAIRSSDPVLVFEHKGLYLRKGSVSRGSHAKVGSAEVVRAGTDVTIAATLLMVDRALAAAEVLGEAVSAEVIDMRWLRPLDIATIESSVGKTGRLVLVEEEVHGGGWAATVVSYLARKHNLVGRIAVVGLRDDTLIPYSPTLEDQVIPSVQTIADSVRALADR